MSAERLPRDRVKYPGIVGADRSGAVNRLFFHERLIIFLNT